MYVPDANHGDKSGASRATLRRKGKGWLAVRSAWHVFSNTTDYRHIQSPDGHPVPKYSTLTGVYGAANARQTHHCLLRCLALDALQGSHLSLEHPETPPPNLTKESTQSYYGPSGPSAITCSPSSSTSITVFNFFSISSACATSSNFSAFDGRPR